MKFDLADISRRLQVSWTSGASTNAWLALDRNDNGIIDDATELFGDLTIQPTPPPGKSRNGFLALAEFDKPENGGNQDGLIDMRDAVFPHLLLWQDANHDGISQPSELRSLSSYGIYQIDLNYTLSRNADKYGNVFRYHSKMSATNGTLSVYDVLLQMAPEIK